MKVPVRLVQVMPVGGGGRAGALCPGVVLHPGNAELADSARVEDGIVR